MIVFPSDSLDERRSKAERACLRSEPATLRARAQTIHLWRLCTRRGCRRVRACRGNPSIRLPRYAPQLPEGVRLWIAGMASAQWRKVLFAEAVRSARRSAHAAFCRWLGRAPRPQ